MVQMLPFIRSTNLVRRDGWQAQWKGKQALISFHFSSATLATLWRSYCSCVGFGFPIVT